jgi:hypothetical protein
MLQYKPNWEETKNRLEALWTGDNDRACMAIACMREDSTYIREKPPEDPAELFRFFTDAEWVNRRQTARFDNMYFGGEALPVVWMNFGTAGHAKYFRGCNYWFAENTVWYDRSLEDGELPEYIGDDSVLAVEKKCMSELSRLGQDRFLVSMPDNCGTLDALAHLRGTNELIFDLIDDPDWVHQATAAINAGYRKSSEELFAIIQNNNLGGSTHGWMQTWTQGTHQQLQVDFSVMISPDMYEEFALPELVEATNWLDRSTYHLDGQEQIRRLDMILSLEKLNMIQWTPVAGQPPTSSFIPELQRIQQAGKGLVLFPQLEEVELLLDKLDHRGLYLIINKAKNEKHAEELLRLAETRRHVR